MGRKGKRSRARRQAERLASRTIEAVTPTKKQTPTCPQCGKRIPINTTIRQLLTGLPCCGYIPTTPREASVAVAELEKAQVKRNSEQSIRARMKALGPWDNGEEDSDFAR